ncbi:MAG TPA: hypothetical protein VF045_02850, partial [Acidimicrobiales bacterium]
RGERLVDDSYLVLLNGGHQNTRFRLPDEKWAQTYELVVDTAIGYTAPAPGLLEGVLLNAGDDFDLEARSLVVLRKTE